MGRRLRAVWYSVSALPTPAAVGFLGVAALLAYGIWQSVGAESIAGLWAGAALVAFGLVDWALLAALPRLGLSFGPVGLPLFLIALVRLLAVYVTARTLQWSQSAWGWPAPDQLPAAGNVVLWLANLGILALEVYGLYIEPFDVRVTHLRMQTPCGSDDRPFRIVHLSDLHVERITKRERSVLEQVRNLEPDVIVITGDYLSGSFLDEPRARQEVRWFLERLKAPHGVYAVTAKRGDTTEAVADMFDGLAVQVLRGEIRKISLPGGDLALLGVSYLKLADDTVVLEDLMRQAPEGSFSVLLYHTPDLVETAAALGVDLYLAGHTHGGQMRLPLFGAVFTNLRSWKKYEQGLYRVGTTNLYVSRGLGMEGRGAPRVRFLCRPEILAVDLRRTTRP